MAHYDDVILPLGISAGTEIGPTTATDVAFTDSGYRKANQRWSNLRYGIRTPEDAYAILKIFEAVAGPANSFLARAWNDWNTTEGRMENGGEAFVTAFDQPLRNTATGGTLGDGTTTTFQMIKRYSVGAAASHTRTLKKPQNGTVKVAVDGVEQVEGVDFTVDYSTGIVTFVSAPGASVSPTAVPVAWGGAFYVPVAFANDDFLESLEVYDGSNPPDIPLIEERL
jgi:uncharacterized protein (TIGR02217 family)